GDQAPRPRPDRPRDGRAIDPGHGPGLSSVPRRAARKSRGEPEVASRDRSDVAADRGGGSVADQKRDKSRGGSPREQVGSAISFRRLRLRESSHPPESTALSASGFG